MFFNTAIPPPPQPVTLHCQSTAAPRYCLMGGHVYLRLHGIVYLNVSF